jgi:hypothetical protein
LDRARADYFWLAGPNLSPAAKLAYVRETWPYWNRSLARARAGSPRHVLSLLGERGAGDAFGAAAAPPASYARVALGRHDLHSHDLHSRDLHSRGPGSRDLAAQWHGGLGADIAPSSVRRGWLSLTLNGMDDAIPSGRCHVCFRPGVDVVVPPPAASIDTPSCADLLAGRFPDARGVRARRNVTFFWAGRVVPRGHLANPMYAAGPNVRTELLRLASRTTGPFAESSRFVVVDSAQGGQLEAHAYMARSDFCWVPPGQRYGDARRHLVAAFHGCIPVFTVPDGHHTLEEVIPWSRMSVNVPQERLPLLPQILANYSRREIKQMRDLLRGWRQVLWYGTSCAAVSAVPPTSERDASVPRDAFEGLMQLLAARLEREKVLGG